jgi:hypothetical protein
VPGALRGLLHRAVDFFADSGDAARQARGVRCVQLLDDMRCGIFGSPLRPKVCGSLSARADLCGVDRSDALRIIQVMEVATA